MLPLIVDPHAWASLATLTALEIVLGVDNIIFLSIAAARLAPVRRTSARRIGLLLALVMRIALLTGIVWIVSLSKPVVTLGGLALSWRDLIFAAGGLFLLTKGTREIHGLVEGDEEATRRTAASFLSVIVQIALFDLVFSIDSVVTAVGMAEHLSIMIAAVILAMLVMLAASGPASDFVNRHPTVKMLALSFLLLIGTALIADAAHFHIPRGYLYFAVAFSALVEALNQYAARASRKRAG
ncbi:MAG TPA: TerC family protein [Rhizomicrobium sp.]|jgi:predicted tellurium resistance membrane protein TerC|nr:TerC family protein [Rhizomicrobium sp.]